jgi:hypothetical protein
VCIVDHTLISRMDRYIKEFVHGDFGRTSPSLGSLLGTCGRVDILSLDVVEVGLEWPPSLGEPAPSGIAGGVGDGIVVSEPVHVEGHKTHVEVSDTGGVGSAAAAAVGGGGGGGNSSQSATLPGATL